MSVPVGILTVSDKCSRGKAVDTSGPALAQLLSEAKTNNRWVVVTTAIVPDDKNLIANTVQNWCTPKSYSAGGMHAEPLCRLVIVTGGTGISPSDVTVGAIEPLFTKRLPSLATAMVVGSLKITPMAALSQVTAGVVCDAAIVLAVPGSKKGSVENVQQVLPALPHAVDTLMARSGTRHLHENVEDTSVDNREAAQAASRSVLCSCSREDEDTTDAGSATHSQHSPDTTITKPIARAANDLSASVVRRARKSPYPMIPVAKALDIVLSNTKTLQPVDLPLCDIRAGQIVARDVVAQENVPAYPASVMDGYAVIATDGPGDYIVRGSSTAGSKEGTVTAENPLLSGQIVRIATGAPMPPGADAVVMVEDTVLLESTHKINDAGEEEEEELRVRILGSGRVEPGQHVRSIGHDLQKGTTVLHAGDAITTVGGEIGTLAISGNRLFSMYVLPKIAVMSTGDEVIDVLGEDASKTGSGPLLDALSYGAIRDSNRPALIAALSALGCPVNDLGVVKDDPDLISESISKALETCEGVITTGGVSMGEKDWLKPVVDQRLGGQILFGRVAMKPSKPTTFATIPQTKNSTENNGQQKQKFVFALPGNPVSALVAFHMFVAPAIRLLSGHALNIAKGVVSGWDNTEEMLSVLRPSVKAAFEGPEITLDRVRPEYVRGMLAWSQKYNKWTAKLMDQKQQSSRMASMQSANVLISLPCGSDAKRTVRHGELVTAIVIATPLFTF